LPNPSPKFTVFIISIASPLLVGVYKNGDLFETISCEEKTSEVLLPVLMEILERFPVSEIGYTRGPGSYMSIKLTYMILKTIETVKEIPNLIG